MNTVWKAVYNVISIKESIQLGLFIVFTTNTLKVSETLPINVYMYMTNLLRL